MKNFIKFVGFCIKRYVYICKMSIVMQSLSHFVRSYKMVFLLCWIQPTEYPEPLKRYQEWGFSSTNISNKDQLLHILSRIRYSTYLQYNCHMPNLIWKRVKANWNLGLINATLGNLEIIFSDPWRLKSKLL